MFVAVILAPDRELITVDPAIRFHLDRLRATGWVGPIAERRFAGGIVLWDADSTHSLLTEDPKGGAFAVIGGYFVGDDTWKGGIHATEESDTWGEYGAVRVTLDATGPTAVGYTDLAGSWPMYSGAHRQRAVISNDPLFIAVALGNTELSTQGAYEVLNYGHALGRETTLTGVHRIFPGESARARGGARGATVSVGAVRRPRFKYVTDSRAEGEQISATAAALTSSLRSITPLATGMDSVTMQISGGLDSRLTAAAIAQVFDERPDMITLDLSDSDEIRIAREVADRLGFPHRVESLDAIGRDDAWAGWILTGGQVSVHAATGNIVGYRAARPGADSSVTIVGGWPGDCLIGSYVPLVATMLDVNAVAGSTRRWAQARETDWVEAGVSARGPLAARVRRVAQATLRRGLSAADGDTAAQRISYWAMFTRQPAFSYISPAILSTRVLAVTPLLARPYVEQLLTLRGTQIIGKNFYRRLILRSFPHLADIEYAATGRPLSESAIIPVAEPITRHEMFHRLPRVARRLIRWAVRLRDRSSRVPRADLSQSASAEIRFWDEFLREEGESGRVILNGLTIDASATGDLHIRSVGLALRWTREHLLAARGAR